jgi:hypothetical protein
VVVVSFTVVEVADCCDFDVSDSEDLVSRSATAVCCPVSPVFEHADIVKGGTNANIIIIAKYKNLFNLISFLPFSVFIFQLTILPEGIFPFH